MSQIFDALLRAETEQGRTGPGAESEATELLRSVEHQASSRWGSSPVAESHDAVAAAYAETLAERLDLLRSGTLQGEQRNAGLAPSGQPDLWRQFRSIPVAHSAESRLVSLAEQADPTSEAFRLLGVRIRELRQTRPLNRVLITSTVPQEGKSTVAANFACTLAYNSGERILLLEGDIRRPSLTRIFRLGEVAGICECLRGERSLGESVFHLEDAGLWILPAGQASANCLDLVQSKKLPAMMNQLSELFDWIIVDSPPILPLADTSIWSQLVDGILLVTRQGVTEKKQLKRGLKVLDPSKVIGALLNSSRASSYSSYYYKTPTKS